MKQMYDYINNNEHDQNDLFIKSKRYFYNLFCLLKNNTQKSGAICFDRRYPDSFGSWWHGPGAERKLPGGDRSQRHGWAERGPDWDHRGQHHPDGCEWQPSTLHSK